MSSVSRFPWMATGVALWLALAPAAAMAQSASSLFQQAIHAEEVVGDLQAAIGLYRRIVDEFPEERALVARALVRIGSSYEKMGDRNARGAYERVVRDFADQRTAAMEAGARLAALDADRRPQRAIEDVAPASGETGGRLLPEVEAEVYAEAIAVSPDATRVAFLGIGGEAPDGWAQTVGVFDYRDRSRIWMTPSGERIAADESYGYAAAWSHDGERLAYTTGLGGSGSQTWVARPGEPPRVVFETTGGDFAAVHDWFHDGSTLVVIVTRADRSVVLGTVSLEAGAFRELRTLEWSRGTAHVSPDDRYVVFADGTRDARDLFVVATDGSSIEAIDQHPALDSQPWWSPDGRHIVFHSDRQGSEAVWAVEVERGRAVGSPRRIMEAAEGVRLMGWGEVGLGYQRYVSLRDLYTASIDPATGGTIAPARMLPFPETGHNFDPRYSPDGRHLAFLRGGPSSYNARRELVILSLDGGPPLVEAPPPEVVRTAIGNVRWNPDGGSLTVTARDQEDRSILGRFSLADRSWRVEHLPVSPWGRYMDWDPSWERMFFGGAVDDVEQGPTNGLAEVDLATGEQRLLWRPPHFPIRAITTSPDGRRIAMTILARLWIFDRELGAATQIPGIRVNSWLSWSPDGRYLLYTGFDAPGTEPAETALGEPRVRVLDVATGVSTDLDVGLDLLARGPLAGLDARLSTPAWAPDGRGIVFGVGGSDSQTWILENPLARASDGPSGLRQR